MQKIMCSQIYIFFFFNFRQRRETIQTCRILIQNRVRSRMIKNLHCLLRFVLLLDFSSTHNFCFNLIFVRQDYKRVLHCFADLVSSHCGWLRLLRRRISWCHLQSSSNQLWSDQIQQRRGCQLQNISFSIGDSALSEY